MKLEKLAFDLGRSEFQHLGLIAFKDHCHARRSLTSMQSKRGFSIRRS